MNKTEAIELLAARNGMTLTASEKYLNSLIGLVYEELQANRSVNISGFGKFSVLNRPARSGVLPRSPHLRISIPAIRSPRFKPGEAFRAILR